MELEFNLFDNTDGRHCLTIMVGNEETELFFEDMDLQGGGYTLEGIVSILLEKENLKEDLEIGAEADNMWIYSKDPNILSGIQKLVTEAFLDEDKVSMIIDESDGNIE